ncbi:MAG: hypothetical protein ABL890_04665 [Candidatus Peribacteraceae bacterium]
MRFLPSVTAGALLYVATTGIALAAPNADLSVSISAPSTVAISTPTVYTVTVRNIGPNTTSNVQAVVTFPQTNTSPQVYILGNLTTSDSNCSIANRQLTCTLPGTLKKNKVATFTYSYTAPVSTKTLEMTAVATSSLPDLVPGNSTASIVPNLVYPSRPLTVANMLNSHCTGTNLTSYFECLLFPSSISSHTATFNIDNTITLTEPGYTGTWSQNTAKTSLKFEYFESTGSGSSKIAEFNGWAINGLNCFEGLTNFFPASQYVSPYRVCVQ